MEELQLFDAEYKFLDIIWELEPVNSTKLTKVCMQKLGWKKSATDTMLRKLSERRILKNENATVTALVKREQVQKYCKLWEYKKSCVNGSFTLLLDILFLGSYPPGG